MPQITTPLVGTETRATVAARIKIVSDFWFDDPFYPKTWADCRLRVNASVDPVLNFLDYSDPEDFRTAFNSFNETFSAQPFVWFANGKVDKVMQAFENIWALNLSFAE